MKNKRRKQRDNSMSAFLNPKKCQSTGKTSFQTEDRASRAMMRMWSHDPQADIFDLHTYQCPECHFWHIGHKSYYEQAKKNDTVSISAE